MSKEDHDLISAIFGGCVEISGSEWRMLYDTISEKTQEVKRTHELLSRAQGLNSEEIRELPDELQGHSRYYLAQLSGDYGKEVEKYLTLRNKLQTMIRG